MAESEETIRQMWHDWFMTDAYQAEKRVFKFFRLLPHDPRCKLCHSPFEGIGGMFVKLFLGRKRSNLNPRFCNICENFSKKYPGGADVEMSMLFVDVRNSTSLSEQMSPSEYKKMINRFYVGVSQVVAEEDGLVESLTGDAVAAFWGAGFAGQNYVARTLRTAQNIQRRMQMEEIPVGIGVNAGVAYFGAMGSADGLTDISAIGEEVNTAARLASKAATGEIIVSEAALAMTDIDRAGLEARSLELKGISKPVPARVMHG